MASAGCRAHDPPTPASANEAPITFKKFRRDNPPSSSVHTEACRGNSRCRYSRNSAVFARSSRLFQYAGPTPCASMLASLSICLCGQDISLRGTGAPPVFSKTRARRPCHTSSIMTHRTVSQLFRVDVILLHQLFPFRLLIRWRLPSHVVNLASWPHEFLRRLMTLHAPLHMQRILLPGQRHLVHFPMARRTPHALR